MSVTLQPLSTFTRGFSHDSEVEACMSPSVELGRDFERLILRCIQENEAKRRQSAMPEEGEQANEDMGSDSNNDIRTNEIHDLTGVKEVVESESTTEDRIDKTMQITSANEKEDKTMASSVSTDISDKLERDSTESEGGEAQDTFNSKNFEEDFPTLTTPSSKSNQSNRAVPKQKTTKRTRRKMWGACPVTILGFQMQRRAPGPSDSNEYMDRELQRFEEECANVATTNGSDSTESASATQNPERDPSLDSCSEVSTGHQPSEESSATIQVNAQINDEDQAQKSTEDTENETRACDVKHACYRLQANNEAKDLGPYTKKATTSRGSRKNRKISFGPRLSSSYHTSGNGLVTRAHNWDGECDSSSCDYDIYMCEDDLYSAEEQYTEKCHWRRLVWLTQFSGKAARKLLRNKHKFQEQKAHRQVKTKHCSSVHRRPHGLSLFIHHRVAKLISMSLGPALQRSSISLKKIDKDKGFIGKYNKGSVNSNSVRPAAAIARRAPPGPRPAHTLTAYNADGDLSADLVNLLLTLQDRDITPEDYDLLLRLDERVKAQTVQDGVLEHLKTDTVKTEDLSDGDQCTVCMEEYEVGQSRKHLPCGHYFHTECIDSWLANSSPNCPLDGQKVEL